MALRARSTASLSLALLTMTATAAIPAAAEPAPEQAEPDSGVADFLHQRMTDSGTPGMAYAVVGPDGVHESGAWGTDGAGDDVTVDTPFLWGSVAKPVTATAVMTLVEDGRIDLDEQVRTYLPEFRLADADASARITVRHLLEQTSGIPEGTGVTDRFDRRDDPYADAVSDLADVQPLTKPGAHHEYTSANYLVLGAVVEAVTGTSYAQYLHEAVLDPLQMDGAVTTPDEAADLPRGHRYVFGRPVAFETEYDQTGASYGYLGGSVTDLAHFAVANLAGGTYEATSILEPDSMTQLHQGSVQLSDTLEYGLGWREDRRNEDLGTTTIWHGGAAPGYQAMVVLLPEKELGLVVVQNVYGFFQDSALALGELEAARLLAGGEPETPAGNTTYPIFLTVLVVLVLSLIAAAAWPLRRMLWPETAKPRSRRRITLGSLTWVVAGGALAYGAGIALPHALGTYLAQIPLFAPDVAGLLIAVVIASIALVLMRTADGALRLRRARRG